MDTSNPVVAADRRSLREVLSLQQNKRRQDLKYLGDVARTSTRNILAVDYDLLPESEVRKIMEEFRGSIPRVFDVKDSDLPPVFDTFLESMPISGILTPEGLPLHPPSINNNKGKVSVRRTMGGAPAPPLGLKGVIEVCGDMVLEREHVYTNGTWEGFCVRLEKQMGRTTKSVQQAYTEVLGIKVQASYLINQLKSLLPRGKSNSRWPRLDGDLMEHFDQLQITSNSSAGAPYWRNKGECLEDVLTVGVPLVCKAIKERSLSKLWTQNPEFFVCEVKNKLDRYKTEELHLKTRPYCSIPAHWALLFSVLTQRFQETLKLFDSSSSSNAYGFNSTKGGLKRFYNWMLTADSRGKVACYGDDTCLVIRKNEKVYRVDPDFQQMDGSLDQQDMALVVKWVLSCLKEEEGELPEFWKVVGAQWTEMASNPIFLLEGVEVYKKKKPNGLLSGVPGTTLFDTVKSVLSWNLYLDHCQNSGSDVLSEKGATAFMQKCGLVIKPGTWNPAVVPVAKPGVLITDHKFLGVQIKVEEYKGELIFVPTVPEREALEMLVVQKDDPFQKTRSAMTASRRLYDRMRGLYITVGFTNPLIEAAIHNVVNQIDPVAILMTTALQGGEKPDHILLEDFAYPDSSGFPTKEFCFSLYSEEKETEGWLSLYPDLNNLLGDLKKESRAVNQILLGDKKKVLVVEDAPPVETPQIQFGDLLAMPPGEEENFKLSKAHSPAARSHIATVSGDVKRKTTPTLGESIRIYLTNVGVSQIGSILQIFKINNKLLLNTCKQYGIFLTGEEEGDLASLDPIQSPFEDLQTEILTHCKATAMTIDKGTSYRTAAAQLSKSPQTKPQVYVATAPEVLILDYTFVKDLGIPPSHSDPEEAVSKFNIYVDKNKNIDSFRWRTTATFVGQNPVEVSMEVRIGQEWLAVGKCRSVSRKMCQKYLVGAVYDYYGVSLKKHQFSTGVLPPPPEFQSWADEMEADEAEEAHQGWDPPIVVLPQQKSEGKPEKAPSELAMVFVQDPVEVETLCGLIHFYRINGWPDWKILEVLQRTYRKYLDLSLDKKSARSQLSAEKRHKMNRKEAERKKRRLASLRHSKQPPQ